MKFLFFYVSIIFLLIDMSFQSKFKSTCFFAVGLCPFRCMNKEITGTDDRFCTFCFLYCLTLDTDISYLVGAVWRLLPFITKRALSYREAFVDTEFCMLHCPSL